jgi:hypothetical protein
MPDNGAPNGGTPATTVPRAVTVVVAFVAIAAYLAMVVVLYVQRDQSDPLWSRAISLFTGVQAVAFAAFGWALGTQVGQGAVAVANNQAQQAGQRADAAQEAAAQAREAAAVQEQKAEQEGERGRRLAEAVRDHRQPSDVGRAQGGGTEDGADDEVLAHARALYPEVFAGTN